MQAFFGTPFEVLLNRTFIRDSFPVRDNGPMYRFAARAAVFAVSLAMALALRPVRAGDDDDHTRARAALEAGQVLPLRTLLERLERVHPGQVLELELEREDGQWIYEVKLLQSGGQLSKIKLDARTAQVLQIKSKNGQGRRSDLPGN